MKKRILSALLSLVLLASLAPAAFAADSNPYKDVSTEDWFYPAVEYMSSNGYMTGYTATEFAPNDTLSRAMFVTVLYRISGEKVNSKETKFTDVPQNTWYSEAVAWAVANGITSGTSNTTFSPDDYVTREQMAVFMKRYIDQKGLNVSNDFTITTTLSDIHESSVWAKDAVQFMYQHGILLESKPLFGSNHEIWPTSYAIRINTAIAFYNLLCLTKGTNTPPLLPDHYYNGSINISCNHNLATRHVDEVGHYESSGTHQVLVNFCGCGAIFRSDDPDFEANWLAHRLVDNCRKGCIQGYREVSDGQQYIVDTPAHDETYCTICGATK